MGAPLHRGSEGAPVGAPMGAPYEGEGTGGPHWGPPVNAQSGAPSKRNVNSEEVLRVLVVGEAATGKTALLQLLEMHAAELGAACLAQQQEDRYGCNGFSEGDPAASAAAAASAASTAAAAAAAAARETARNKAACLPALLGYHRTCGVNIMPLRCTDTAGKNYLLEFWEVGGASATKAARTLLYATPFDGLREKGSLATVSEDAREGLGFRV
ncbi:hypothetical protein, conserved [Eimeria acervulina]|uniref:Uncharacterized protein n=1 Tax=Eimeria acervulina TaxID=5801 RepID=U6GGH3_EIMAC|nr:hypothetical protein, conserved [Eimeria acervulina]CDI78642.1 hypothetical protein, conserved [Eimeria acervulina]